MSSVSPSELTIGASAQLSIIGTDFEDTATVSLCQAGRVTVGPVTFVDDTHLLADVTVEPDSPTGTCSLAVRVPGQAPGVLTQAVTLVSDQPPPTLDSVAPDEIEQDTSTQLTLQGSDFQDGATVTICASGGVAVDLVQFVDPTQLLVDVTVAPDAALETCFVRVRNPDRQMALLASAVTILPPPGPPAPDVPLVEYPFEDDPAGGIAFNLGSLGPLADATLGGPVDGPFFTTEVSRDGSQTLFFGELGIDALGEPICTEGDASGWAELPDALEYLDPTTGRRLEELTLETWVWSETTTVAQTIFADDAKGIQLQLRKQAADVTLVTEEDPEGATLVGGLTTSKRWHHLAVIYDGAEIRTYIDGQDTCLFAPTSGGILRAPAGTSALGQTGVWFLCGALDDFRIHPRAFDPAELADGAFTPNECPICGDGMLEAPEECDPPGATCADGSPCGERCQCEPTFDGTTWDVALLDVDTLEGVGSDVFTFAGGGFASDEGDLLGCTPSFFEEFPVIAHGDRRLRATAELDCPDGSELEFQIVSPCRVSCNQIPPGLLEGLSGWRRVDNVRTHAIVGEPIPE